MNKIKYLKDGAEDSAGHTNGIIAVNSATLHAEGNGLFVAVQLNKYKDAESKLAGKSQSIDRVRPERLYLSDLGISPVEFHNMIVETIAKKHSLEIVEFEGELQLKSPVELKAEKLKAEKTKAEK